MLVLKLARIRTAHEHFEETYPVQTFADQQDDFSVVAPVALAFDVEKDKSNFRLTGRVRTMLELPCSRCLEPFGWPLDMAFDLRYQPRGEQAGSSAEGASNAEREVEEDDLTTAFYENDEIDLVQLMREQFYLSLPMKPLCSDDCRGLCPGCGTNLNRGTCSCTRGWEDPRFASLNELRSKS